MIVGLAIFKFRPGAEQGGIKQMRDQLSFAQNQKGHLRSFLACSVDDPRRFLMYCEWDRRENYEAMNKKLAESDDGGFAEFFTIMTEEPIFGSFKVVK